MRGKAVFLALLVGAMLVAIPTPVGADGPLDSPHVNTWEWHGYLKCAVGTPILVAHACGFLANTPLEDPDHDFLFEWTVGAGLREVVVGARWDPTVPTAQRLVVLFENAGCGFAECSYQYAAESGPSPIVFQIGDDDISDPEWLWSAITESRDLQIRVFPAFEVSVFIEQPFEVRIEEYYFQDAPENRDPFEPLA